LKNPLTFQTLGLGEYQEFITTKMVCTNPIQLRNIEKKKIMESFPMSKCMEEQKPIFLLNSKA